MPTLSLPTAERARLITQTLLQMEKQFGKGSVLQLGSRSVQQVSVIPTGSNFTRRGAGRGRLSPGSRHGSFRAGIVR
jgi:recombination protein RecA